ncbi:hypothetical protein EUX98_g7053 [Antrodiella citrinella]|uniref:Uncharacterized protein n=1 Tax=Antrodiella citrinella TaxID=2447956 RepID=A0A4S4MPZ6_9APHY|nr:hypothetical protein EUX98_g7053 [Antrodiella citrinella]
MSQTPQKKRREAKVKAEPPSATRVLRPRVEGKVVKPSRDQAPARVHTATSPIHSPQSRRGASTPFLDMKSTSAGNTGSMMIKNEDSAVKLPVYPNLGNGHTRAQADGGPFHTSTSFASVPGPGQEAFPDGRPTMPYSKRYPATSTLSTSDWSALMEQRRRYIYTDRQGNWQEELASDDDDAARGVAREPSLGVICEGRKDQYAESGID